MKKITYYKLIFYFSEFIAINLICFEFRLMQIRLTTEHAGSINSVNRGSAVNHEHAYRILQTQKLTP